MRCSCEHSHPTMGYECTTTYAEVRAMRFSEDCAELEPVVEIIPFGCVALRAGSAFDTSGPVVVESLEPDNEV